jgi:transposase
MRSIGLDVHRQFAEVAVAQGGQAVPSGHRFEATPAGLLAFARSLGKEDQVVLEATVNTWAIVDVLAAHAGRVVVSNPLRTRAIASAKVKTDKIDAATLAQLLAADFLPEVWIPDPETRSRRAQVAHRAGLVQQRSRLRNRVEAVLHRNLLECPWTDTFGKRGCQWLAHLNLPSADREQLDSTLRQLDCMEAEVARADQLIAETTLGDPRIQRLMTIPGVGVTTAAALVAVVGDVARFPRPNQLVGYLGLDPRVRQSGNKPAYTGHISRQGQAHARGLLVEAAHAAVRRPGPLRAFYLRIRARRGSQVALVAVARKLAILTWHLLTKGEDYHWASPTRTAEKLRAVAIKAGAPKLPNGRPGVPRARRGAGEDLPSAHRSVEALRKRADEDGLALQAEQAYRTLVAGHARDRRGSGAAGRRLLDEAGPMV